MCLWGWFRERLTCKSVHWARKTALTSVGGHHQSIDGMNRTKRQREDLSVWTGTSIFSCPQTLVLLVPGAGLGFNTIDCPKSQAFRLGLELCSQLSLTSSWHFMGLLSLYNLESQYFISLYILLVLFLCRALTNTNHSVLHATQDKIRHSWLSLDKPQFWWVLVM